MSNVGDMHAAPHLYFGWLGKRVSVRDIWGDKVPATWDAVRGAHIILGGGGLFAHSSFEKNVRDALGRGPLTRVAWGGGRNFHTGNAFSSEGYPDYLKSFDLVGVRDSDGPYPWVPCASALHPGLDPTGVEPKHEIVGYWHKDQPVPVAGMTSLTNAGMDITRTLEFLASGDTVLTNSYHGAYWATLLGRRVVIVDAFSTKFHTFRHQPPITSGSNWMTAVDIAQRFPEALDECREANRIFADKCLDLFVSRGFTPALLKHSSPPVGPTPPSRFGTLSLKTSFSPTSERLD